MASPVSCLRTVCLPRLPLVMWLAIATGLGPLVACRSEPPADHPPIELPELSTASPQDAARGVLATLAKEREARRRGDKAAARACFAALRGVAAEDVILARYRNLSRRPPATDDEIIERYVGTWPSLVGLYVDNILIEQLAVQRDPKRAEIVEVLVPATAPGDPLDRARIRLECVQTENGWRVARVDFAPPATTTAPATQPRP